MSFRGAIKKGGGFWNNVDRTLVGYSFTTVSPGANGSESEWVYLVPQMRADGATAVETQHLFLGSIERYDISEEGQTLTDTKGENVTVGEKTPAGLFLASMIDANPEIERYLPDLEAGEPLNLKGIVGGRFQLAQEKDAAGTAKRGQRVDPKNPTQKYDRTNTVVSQVLALPSGVKAGVKVAAASKANGKAGQPVAANTVADLAKAVVVGAAKKGAFKLKQIPVKSINGLKQDQQEYREAVTAYLSDVTNLAALAEEGVISFDGETISAA